MSGIIKSAQRVMEIFELFDEARYPLSLQEICVRLDYPISSGAALLKSLIKLGYLEYDKQSRTYFPTMRIAVMGSWIEPSLQARTGILPIMKRLLAETEQTVFLGTRSDLYAQYVHVLRGKTRAHFAIPPGTLRPLTRSGMGLLFLSLLTQRELEHTLRRVNAAEPDRSLRRTVQSVEVEIATIKDQGYTFRKNIFHADGSIVAMLLPGTSFNRRFAIGLGGNTEYMTSSLSYLLDRLRSAVSDMEQLDAIDAP